MSKTINRQPCPECNSKDNLCSWEHQGRVYQKCRTPDCKNSSTVLRDKNNQTKLQDSKQESNYSSGVEYQGGFIPLTCGRYEDLNDRGIPKEICEKNLYQVGEIRGRKVHIVNLPNKEGKIVAQKIRYVDNKTFFQNGNCTKERLFGWHLLDFSKDIVYITEGEIDKMTLDLLGLSALSLNGGAGDQTTTEMKQHVKELEKHFKKIVLCFDQDEVGQKAVEDVAKLFSPGKLYLVKLRFKDSNEYITKNLL